MKAALTSQLNALAPSQPEQRFGAASVAKQGLKVAGQVLERQALKQGADTFVQQTARQAPQQALSWGQRLQAGWQAGAGGLKKNLLPFALLTAPFALLPLAPLHLGVGASALFYTLSLTGDFLRQAFMGVFHELKFQNLSNLLRRR